MQREPWEEAFLAASQDAAVGRLFRGIVHNLNGVVQVFALQTDLLILMMEKVVATLRQVQQASPSQDLAGLLDFISRRSNMLPQMQEKVRQSQQILHRTAMLPDFRQLPAGSSYTINALLLLEVEFLCADNFFKHKVARKMDLAATVPPLAHCHLELHQLVHILLVNALEAVQEEISPEILLETWATGEEMGVVIQDNGPGMTEEIMARMYEAFFSSKEGHQGLGLYLARKLACRCNGTLSCESRPGCTRFTLRIPCLADQL